MFSANMRLGKNITDKQKREMVDDTIQELGLDRCADTKVMVTQKKQQRSNILGFSISTRCRVYGEGEDWYKNLVSATKPSW